MAANPELADAIAASASRLGISPVDLATVISYETAGTFDPWKAGPTTQWGQHRGLIQWGEPQRAKYGVYQGMPIADQLSAAESYLKDAGLRPGMGLLDLYSAINAGRVGRYNASDAGNGGAPGTVADKVNYQMEGHKQKAAALLGILANGAASAPPPSQPGAQPAVAPPSAALSMPMGLLAMASQPQTDPQADAAREQAAQGLMSQIFASDQQLQQQAPDMGLLAMRSAFPQISFAKFKSRRG